MMTKIIPSPLFLRHNNRCVFQLTANEWPSNVWVLFPLLAIAKSKSARLEMRKKNKQVKGVEVHVKTVQYLLTLNKIQLWGLKINNYIKTTTEKTIPPSCKIHQSKGCLSNLQLKLWKRLITCFCRHLLKGPLMEWEHPEDYSLKF